MIKIGIMVSTNSTTTIIFFMPIDYYFFCKKRISISNDRGDIKVIANIATHNTEVMSLSIKISPDCIVVPVMVMINNITSFHDPQPRSHS